MKLTWKGLCIVACLVIGLSVLLPFFSVSGLGITVSKSLKDGNDWIYAIVIAAAAIVLSLLGKYLPVAFLGAASLGFFFIEKNSVTTNLGKEIDTIAKSIIQNEAGYFFLLIGSIALIVFAVLGLAEKAK